MNSIDAHDNARRSTRLLIVIYVLVTALIFGIVTFTMAPVYYYKSEMIKPMFSGGREPILVTYEEIPKDIFVIIAILTPFLLMF